MDVLYSPGSLIQVHSCTVDMSEACKLGVALKFPFSTDAVVQVFVVLEPVTLREQGQKPSIAHSS